MKRIFMLPLVLLLGILLVACSQNKESDSSKKNDSADNAEEQSQNESLKVDQEGIVEIPIPVLLLEDQSIDEVITELEEYGVEEVVVNDDGSLTCKMSKSVHEILIKKLEVDILEMLEEFRTSGGFESINDVTYNKNLDKIKLIVDREVFEYSGDGDDDEAADYLSIIGMIYQLFRGTNPEKLKLTVIFEDESNGDEIQKFVYPDDL